MRLSKISYVRLTWPFGPGLPNVPQIVLSSDREALLNVHQRSLDLGKSRAPKAIPSRNDLMGSDRGFILHLDAAIGPTGQ